MTFEVIPAIDLTEGEVVRVEQGDLTTKTVYDTDPVAVAQRWQDAGAARIHVIDLDGAVAGEPRHREDVARIIAATDVRIQVGGGVRNLEAVRGWVDWGADRVVVGTAAITDPAFLSAALDAYATRIVVALDARDGILQLSGWREGSDRKLVDTALELARAGVRRFLVTDISRDGMLTGPNLDQIASVAEAAGVPVIAAGGVSSVEDLVALAALEPRGVEGSVVGRALYTGAVDLAGSLAAVG